MSFIGHTSDSLWSVDLFRCDSIVLRSYWALVVMDQFTRRLVGIGMHCGAVTGADLCCMFNAAIHGQGAPRHLSTDHEFQVYFNAARSHASLEGHTPLAFASGHTTLPADLSHVRWLSHCRGLVQLPVAA